MPDQSIAPTDRKLFVTIESEFSIAARAYRIVMKTLETVEAAPAEDFVRTLGATYTEIESILSVWQLHWQPQPLARFMHTQLQLLHETLDYMAPKRLQGYGPLAVGVDEYLQTWCQTVSLSLETLAYAIKRQAAEPPAAQKDLLAGTSPGAQDVLTAHQHAALNAYLHVFTRSLLLLQALITNAVPPVCPAFRSAYDVRSIEQMLSSIWRIGRDIQTLEMSLGVPAPWTTAWIDTVVYYTHQSQEATQQILKVAHDLNGDQRQPFFGLYQASHQLYRYSLDLQASNGSSSLSKGQNNGCGVDR